MKEYPKALYKDGDAAQDFIEVTDAEDEADGRADGYKPLSEGPKVEPARRGRPPKPTLESPTKTTLAAEKPEDGYIYATSGSAPSPGFPSIDKTEVKEVINQPAPKPEKAK